MEAIELRKKTDELEMEIKILVERFIKDVGSCNVDISTDISFAHQLEGKKILARTGVKVNVTV